MARCCLATLANLMRQDMGIVQALDANVVTHLREIVDIRQRDFDMLVKGLQALWNLSNTPDGKVAVVDAAILPILAQHCSISGGQPQTRRLAAGCIMAVTINKEGKMDSLCCLEPLITLLLHVNASDNVDLGTVRSAVLALKNSAEYPQARKTIERYARAKGCDPHKLVNMIDGDMFDADVWPSSQRYRNQWRGEPGKA